MIRDYIEEGAYFLPEAIGAMARAFADVCNELRIPAGDDHGREVIATRIIDLARAGVLDSNALRDRVLSEARMAARIDRTDGPPVRDRRAGGATSLRALERVGP
jgi:hypothetical protein